jgi:hypothetical protein
VGRQRRRFYSLLIVINRCDLLLVPKQIDAEVMKWLRQAYDNA